MERFRNRRANGRQDGWVPETYRIRRLAIARVSLRVDLLGRIRLTAVRRWGAVAMVHRFAMKPHRDVRPAGMSGVRESPGMRHARPLTGTNPLVSEHRCARVCACPDDQSAGSLRSLSLFTLNRAPAGVRIIRQTIRAIRSLVACVGPYARRPARFTHDRPRPDTARFRKPGTCVRDHAGQPAYPVRRASVAVHG